MRNASRWLSSYGNYGILLLTACMIILSASCDSQEKQKLSTPTGVAEIQTTVISTATPENKVQPEAANPFVPSEKIIVEEVPFERDRWTEYPSTTTKGLETVRTFNEIAMGMNGMIWFTTTDGVVKFDGSTWKTYTKADGLPYNDWSAIAVDQKGVVWVGGREISRFAGHSWEVIMGNKEGVSSIAIDKDNNIWFGTDSGLISFDGKNWDDYGTESDLFKNNKVWDIDFDSKNDLWCATEKGLIHYNGTLWEIIPVARFWYEYGEFHGVEDLTIGSDDSIWMLIGRKITRYKDGKWTNYDVTALIGGYFGVTIFASKEGILWIGGVSDINNKSVLINFDGKEWRRFEGLPIKAILNIDEDAEGNLWLATGAAAYQYKIH